MSPGGRRLQCINEQAAIACMARPTVRTRRTPGKRTLTSELEPGGSPGKRTLTSDLDAAARVQTPGGHHVLDIIVHARFRGAITAGPRAIGTASRAVRTGPRPESGERRN